MIFKPELNNKLQVLSWYDSRENSCFIIFTGVKCDAKNIFSKWINEDGNEGRERLSQSLQFIEDNVSNSNTYTIMSFAYEEGLEAAKVKDLEGETIRFQFHISGYSINGQQPQQTQIIETNKQSDFSRDLFLMMQKQNDLIFQRFEQIEIKLSERQQEEDEEEDDEDIEPEKPTGKERLLGALAGIIERPEFTETLFTVGAALLGKLFDNKKNEDDHDSV